MDKSGQYSIDVCGDLLGETHAHSSIINHTNNIIIGSSPTTKTPKNTYVKIESFMLDAEHMNITVGLSKTIGKTALEVTNVSSNFGIYEKLSSIIEKEMPPSSKLLVGFTQIKFNITSEKNL